MSKATNGWNGANISRDGYCNLCLKDFDGCEMRDYNGPGGVHVPLCSECADKIIIFWLWVRRLIWNDAIRVSGGVCDVVDTLLVSNPDTRFEDDHGLRDMLHPTSEVQGGKSRTGGHPTGK